MPIIATLDDMLITEPPPDPDDLGNAEAAAKERAEQIQLDGAPELLDRGFDHGVVLRRRAAGVVVQYVQPAEVLHRGADRGLEAGIVGHIGADGDRAVAGEMRGFVAGGGVDVGDGDTCAFARKQEGGGSTDAGAGTGDEVRSCR